jgi:nanoRNase/pAp phosphatase (c-di-AMP/oligoRNAs hydrolase)
MKKTTITTIHEKNEIIKNIIDAMIRRNHFLILGHQNPDEDCISSMVAVGLLLVKFYKDTNIYLGSEIHEHFHYLLNICRYNSIKLMRNSKEEKYPVDTVFICDTPKIAMLDIMDWSVLKDPNVLKIEIDHHIGADSEYIGDEGHCLVTEASSASELIGHIAFKLSHRKDLLEQFHVTNIFSRNLVLAILTGIVGDSQMGQFLKSKREKRYYSIFSTLFNTLLARETIKETNFSSMEEIFLELQKNTAKEESCFQYIMQRKRFSPSVGYVILSQDDMRQIKRVCDIDAFIAVSRSVANTLADESRRFSLVAYYDDEDSDLVQFRMRRSYQYKLYDLRNVLNLFSIQNGGGHEGAIGFRVPKKDIENLHRYVEYIIQGIEKAVA